MTGSPIYGPKYFEGQRRRQELLGPLVHDVLTNPSRYAASLPDGSPPAPTRPRRTLQAILMRCLGWCRRPRTR